MKLFSDIRLYNSERPTPLRREKTFDLDPKKSIKDAKVRRLILLKIFFARGYFLTI